MANPWSGTRGDQGVGGPEAHSLGASAGKQPPRTSAPVPCDPCGPWDPQESKTVSGPAFRRSVRALTTDLLVTPPQEPRSPCGNPPGTGRPSRV